MRSAVLFIISCYISLSAQAALQDTSKKRGEADTSDVAAASIVKIGLGVKSPIRAASFSLLVPGGGQFYTGNYIKSGLFFKKALLVTCSERLMGAFLYSEARFYILFRSI